MRDQPAIQYMTTEDAETINACLCLCHQILYGKDKHIETSDERMTEERLEETIAKLMPEN